jgi:NAD(P)H dehydrogenase (quinone)
MNKNIAVIGAAGASGQHIVSALVGRATTRALVHSERGAAEALAAGADDTAVVELEHVGSVASALDGIDAVVMIPPALHSDENVLASNAMRAARDAGVGRFVYLSVLHPYTPTMAHHLRKAEAEAQLRHSQLEWTILQPAMFAQVIYAMFGSRPTGPVVIPFDVEQRFASIDLVDLAEVAAKVLLEDGHEHASYALAGGAATMAEYVLTAGHLRGVELQPQTGSPEGATLPPTVAEGSQSAADMRAMFGEYDQHGLHGNANVLTYLLGRAPHSFGEVVLRILDAERSAA